MLLFLITLKLINMQAPLYIDINNPSHPGGPSPKEHGWIYLGYSCHNLRETKIGHTTRSLYDRMRQTTTNPYYTLFAAFHIPRAFHGQIKAIERYVEWKCAWSNIPLPSGNPSEWYRTSPGDVLSQMVGRMCNRLPGILNEDGDFDYTSFVYLPTINPYFFDLDAPDLERFTRLSAPQIYIEDLQKGWTTWPERPNFLAELAATNVADSLLIAGPEILRRRLNYDAACREPVVTRR